MAGMDPLAFVREGDPFVRALMLAIAVEYRRFADIRDRNLAVMTAEQVGNLFK